MASLSLPRLNSHREPVAKKKDEERIMIGQDGNDRIFIIFLGPIYMNSEFPIKLTLHLVLLRRPEMHIQGVFK